jgi:4-amino-4-deoxy-L-arabinose transferase-like glycosyltransferase
MGRVRVAALYDRSVRTRLGTNGRPLWTTFGIGLACLSVAGAIARIVFALRVAPDLALAGDAHLYREVAANVSGGHGFSYRPIGGSALVPTAEHPPVFILLLAAFDRVGLGSLDAQRVALAVVAAGCIPLIGLLGRRLGGTAVGLLAAAIAAFHPLWVQPPGVLMSEAVFMALFPAVLLAGVEARRHPSAGRAAALGLLIGLLTLTRPEGLGLVVLVGAPAAFLTAVAMRQRWRHAAIIVVACILVVAPWPIRNKVQLDTFALSTNGGKTLYGSTCEDSFDGPGIGSFSYFCLWTFVDPEVDALHGEAAGSVVLDQRMGERGVEYLRDHLDELPRVIVARLARTWGLGHTADQLQFDVEEGRDRDLQRAGRTLHLVLLPLALLGLVVGLRGPRRRDVVIVLGPVLLTVGSSLAFYGMTRMRAGAEPSLAVLAALGAVHLLAVARRLARPAIDDTTDDEALVPADR